MRRRSAWLYRIAFETARLHPAGRAMTASESSVHGAIRRLAPYIQSDAMGRQRSSMHVERKLANTGIESALAPLPESASWPT